jgi:hypothetical protein
MQFIHRGIPETTVGETEKAHAAIGARSAIYISVGPIHTAPNWE